MITISTLNEATAQQVFDQVANHLLTQGKRATNGNGSTKCRYRTRDGLMCAAGCLMADEEYSESFENMSFEALSFAGIQARRLRHYEMIQELQELHDLAKPEDWRADLKAFAVQRDLEWQHVLGD